MTYKIRKLQTTITDIDTGSFIQSNQTSSMLAPYILTSQTSSMSVYSATKILVPATNDSGLNISKGQPVKVYGPGSDLSVTLASAHSHAITDADHNEYLGIAYEDILSPGSGSIIIEGVFDSIDTSLFTAGDTLYLSSSLGQLTNTKLNPPYDIIKVGYVLVSATTGSIILTTEGPTRLNDLTNVSASNLVSASGHTLVYDYTTNVWYNTNRLSITGSVFGTASWAESASVAFSSSVSVSSSYAVTASYATNSATSSYTISASYAPTASLVPSYANMVFLMGG